MVPAQLSPDSSPFVDESVKAAPLKTYSLFVGSHPPRTKAGLL